jgi:hypothetical protein
VEVSLLGLAHENPGLTDVQVADRAIVCRKVRGRNKLTLRTRIQLNMTTVSTGVMKSSITIAARGTTGAAPSGSSRSTAGNNLNFDPESVLVRSLGRFTTPALSLGRCPRSRVALSALRPPTQPLDQHSGSGANAFRDSLLEATRVALLLSRAKGRAT